MKSKISLLCILFLAVLFFAVDAFAEPAIIKDIVIDTQDASVKITITSSQTLQIETFKNDESPANYIVLDFIGSVYTNMPSIIDVGKGAVEKVSLVRGEESQISVDGQAYYSLDFLAINLTSAAEYQVNQSQSVIDLSIGSAGQTVVAGPAPVVEENTVDLSPPIVVSRQQPQPEIAEEKTEIPEAVPAPVISELDIPDYSNYDAIVSESLNSSDMSSSGSAYTGSSVSDLSMTERESASYSYRSMEEPAVEISTADSQPEQEEISEEKRSVRRKKSVSENKNKRKKRSIESKNRKRKGGFLWFGKRDAAATEKIEQPKAVSQPEQKVAPAVPMQPVRTETGLIRTKHTSGEGYLIDRIVEETIRERQMTAERIETLTMQLKKLQEDLYQTKGEKTKLDERIDEIIARLDQLKGALDAEIKRRQALGEKVDDLIAQREAYVKAKQKYEELQLKLDQVSAVVDRLNGDYKQTGTKLESARSEKRKLEDDATKMETEYTQLKRQYDEAVKMKDSITLTIDKINRELEELRKTLEKTIDDKARIVAELKNFETQSRLSGNELARLRQLLLDKNAELVSLARRHEQLKANLDIAVSDKFKVEYSYRNAKTEYERIKTEIETYLQHNR